jgi:hypothetical protein
MAETEALHPLRPFLRNWVWEHGHIGTRYLDCSDGEVKFDDGKKARFAAESIFFVPLGSDADDASRGAGPAIHEGALARFLRAAQLGKPEEAGSVPDVQRAAQDCVELGLVCAYQQEAQQALARYALEPMLTGVSRSAEAAPRREKAIAALKKMLAATPAPGTNTVLVSHGFNLWDAEGFHLGTQGEAAIYIPDGKGGYALVARLLPREWVDLP